MPHISGVLRSILDRHISTEDLKNGFASHFLKANHYFTYFEWNPINAGTWLLSLMIIFSAIRKLIAGKVEVKDTYEDRSDYGSHGTAQWMPKEEIQKIYYSGEKGFIVGDLQERIFLPDKQYAVIPNNGKTNMNIIAFGPPGSEKTTGLIFPNLYHVIRNLGYSFVTTDPKGEIYTETAAEAEKYGYEVQVLDFLNLLRGNRINILDFIFDETDLLKIADSYVTGANIAKGSKGSSDPIWDDGEKSLLGALMGFVKQVYKDTPEKQTLTTISEIVRDEFVDPERYPYLFQKHGVTGTAEALFKNFLLAKDKVRDGILFGLATKLTLFSIPSVQNLTCTSDFDVKDLGRRKIALYIMVSDADRTYSPLVTVFWSIFFNSIYNLRLTEPDAKTPIFCAMDELANIGRIGGLQEKLGTMRSRHLYPMMIWQSLPQLQDRYPDNAWKDVISMCDTRFLLAANDEDTQKYFSNLLGKKTVEIQGVSKNIKREDLLHNGEGESINYTGRPLLFPDEIGKMPGDQIIMVQKGKDPVRMRKLQYQYWEDKYRICDAKPYNSIPLLPRWDDHIIKELIDQDLKENSQESDPEEQSILKIQFGGE